MIENPKTFDHLRLALLEMWAQARLEGCELTKQRQDIENIIDEIQQQIKDCCNCFQE